MNQIELIQIKLCAHFGYPKERSCDTLVTFMNWLMEIYRNCREIKICWKKKTRRRGNKRRENKQECMKTYRRRKKEKHLGFKGQSHLKLYHIRPRITTSFSIATNNPNRFSINKIQFHWNNIYKITQHTKAKHRRTEQKRKAMGHVCLYYENSNWNVRQYCVHGKLHFGRI